MSGFGFPSLLQAFDFSVQDFPVAGTKMQFTSQTFATVARSSFLPEVTQAQEAQPFLKPVVQDRPREYYSRECRNILRTKGGFSLYSTMHILS